MGEYVSRPLLCENFIFAFLWVCYDLPAIECAAMPLLQKKPSSISFTPCQSLRISFYPSSSQSILSSVVRFSCLQSRSAPSRSSPLLSRLYFVFVSISSMSSLQYRRYTLIRSFVLRPSFPHFRRQFSTFITSPSSMYSRTPLLLLIYSQLGFQLPPTLPCLYPRLSSPIVIVVIVSVGAGTAPGGGGPRGAYECTCRGKPSMCTKRIQPEKGSKGCRKKGDRVTNLGRSPSGRKTVTIFS